MAVVVVMGAGVARADVAPDEREAYERARPVFEKYCTKCHSAAGAKHDDLAMKHLDMSTYPFGGHHGPEAAQEVREALGLTGEQPTMPDDAPGSVQGDDLALVVAWADAFDRAHGQHGGMEDMHGMDMGGMHMDENMHDTFNEMPVLPFEQSMARDASGTAWQPDTTRTAMHMLGRGSWMLMLHYALQAGVSAQAGARGDTRGVALGWVMGQASHWFVGGQLDVRAMLSPEPMALGKRGYPLLLQTGEEVGGMPLVDRQHPHDLFMELALRWRRAVASDVAIDLYAALAGEPALGPVAFAHRPYALYDMTAPLGHHWQDSTHVSFGVVTAGVYGRDVKLEASWFNGREPDENRYDFDLRGFDSYSARLSIAPAPEWTAELSYGYLASPEALEPDVSQDRLVASVTYAGPHADVTAVVGRDMPSVGRATTAGLLEASGNATDRIVVFGRAELLQKLGADLALAPAVAGDVFGLGSLTLGAVYELPAKHGVVLGLGAHGTVDLVGREPAVYYGTTTPVGGYFFVEAHPAR
jgi:hypothetical protein